jgi:mono/diheme cytochrome c family protein
MEWLFVIAPFFVIGVGVAFVAFFCGPGGAREAYMTGGRRAFPLIIVLIYVALGIAVPAAVIATDKNRDSIPEANVKDLTSLQKEGADLFGQRCRMCHTLKAANATGKTGPNLDDAPRNKALVLDAIEKGRAAGNGNMPAQVYEGRDAEAVAEFVAVATGGSLDNPEPEETPSE